MHKQNIWQKTIVPIASFLIIEQLLENTALFQGLNILYKHTGISQSLTQFLFKVGELILVLILNQFLTKQHFYFKRQFTKWDWVFWIVMIAGILLRLRSVPTNTLIPSIMVGLPGGVPEEMMIRGVVMTKLMTATNRIKSSYGRILLAVVISNLVFALLHLNNLGQLPLSYVLTQVFVVFGSGLIYSAIYVRTGSLWYPIFWHFMSDFLIQAGGDRCLKFCCCS